MVCLVAVAVNRNHTSFVLAVVAPPQAPAGAVGSGVAASKSPVTLLQVVAGVSKTAEEQLACAQANAGEHIANKAMSWIRIIRFI